MDAQPALPLPALPEMSSDGTRAILTRQGVIDLMAYRETAEGNTAIADANAAGLEAQSAAYNKLRECSQYQREFSAIREEQLAIERAEHAQDNWLHRGVIVLTVALGMTL